MKGWASRGARPARAVETGRAFFPLLPMITVLLDDGGRPRMPTGALERAARAACESLGVEVAEISVALLDDPAIASMNEGHLGHEGPTDVLAFALYEEGEP